MRPMPLDPARLCALVPRLCATRDLVTAARAKVEGLQLTSDALDREDTVVAIGAALTAMTASHEELMAVFEDLLVDGLA
jgi:hypothetical protein